MIDLTEIIVTLIGLVATVLATFLIPYLKQKMSAEKFNEMQMWVSIAVKAAEMLYTGAGRGEEKKTYVTEFLNSKGYTIDAASIENMIEAAVLEMQNSMAQ